MMFAFVTVFATIVMGAAAQDLVGGRPPPGGADMVEARTAFNGFKAQYGKHYPTTAEEQKRFAIFLEKYRYVKNFNAKVDPNDPDAVSLGINEMSDRTEDEMSALINGPNSK